MAAPESVTFTTTLHQAGATATGIIVPDELVAALGAGKRPPVIVTIGTYAYRSTLAVMGGQQMVGVSAEHRKGAGIAAGDTIEVTLTLDEAPRTVDVPDDLAAALDAAGVREAFDRLAYSHRKEHVRAIEDAKKPETRANRIAKAVEKVGG